MEEAIVDVALDLNLRSSEELQVDARQDMSTENQDQAQPLARVPQGSPASSPWLRNRTARVEALRLSIANGTYRVDSTELAQCLLRNSTRFLETC